MEDKYARIIPLQLNIQAWLEDHKTSFGPFYPNQKTHGCGQTWKEFEDDLSRELERIRNTSGLQTKVNALRHGFGSHRLAVTQSHAAVALEMGNSVAMVRKHYASREILFHHAPLACREHRPILPGFKSDA